MEGTLLRARKELAVAVHSHGHPIRKGVERSAEHGPEDEEIRKQGRHLATAEVEEIHGLFGECENAPREYAGGGTHLVAIWRSDEPRVQSVERSRGIVLRNGPSATT